MSVQVSNRLGLREFEFYFYRELDFKTSTILRIKNHSDKSVIYTFDNFSFGPIFSAGQVGSFWPLEAGGHREHVFTLELAHANVPGAPTTRGLSLRNVLFGFGLSIVYEPTIEAAEQVDPHGEDHVYEGIKSYPELLTDPDGQELYIGAVHIPPGVSADYTIKYSIE